MNDSNAFLYTIRPGDNLYMLAGYYNTTVDDILVNNRQINPYNLNVGEKIIIYPNTTNNDAMSCISAKQMELSDHMNSLWEQHVFWTRLLLISIAENLGDLEYTQDRLLRNPKDIAEIYRIYYGDEVAGKIEELLTEHLKIGAGIITALNNGESDRANELTKQWYKNADDMAKAFAGINPYYNEQEVRQMLYDHLDLTTKEVTDRLSKNYEEEIQTFDRVEREVLMMARYFTDGIVKQFPDMF